MRAGLLVPVSSNAFAIAIIIAFLGVIIYSIYYAISKSIHKENVQRLKESFCADHRVSESFFGFPESSSRVFPVKYFDDRLGFATQRTSGAYGLAMCVHSKLKFTRLYFFVDFASFGYFQAILRLGSEGGEMIIKISPESSMFSHESLRYYDLPVEARQILIGHRVILRIDSEDYIASDELTRGFKDAFECCEQLKSEERKKFLTWGD